MARKPKSNYSKNGHAYFRIKRKVPDGDGFIYKEFYGKSETEAVGKYHDYLANINETKKQELTKENLDVQLEEWFWNIYYRSFTKDTTFARYEGVYTKYIKPLPILKSKVSKLTTQDFQKVYNQMSDEEKASDHTLKLMKLILKAFFDYAVQQRMALVNIMTGVLIPKKKLSETFVDEVDDNPLEYFTNEELRHLIQGSKGHKLHGFFTVKLLTGGRRGELLALKWSKVDLDKRIIDVSSSVTTTYVYDENRRRKMQVVVSTTKNESSKRIIPFTANLVPVFKAIKHQQKLDRLKAGDSYKDNDLVFCTSVGTYHNPSNVEKSWRNLLKKLGLEHKKLHSLRHTYATELFDRGAKIEVVSKLLGHKEIGTTQEIYVHVLPEAKVSTADLLSDLLSDS